jgi:uncharacterized protein (DUF4415 family)
MKHGEMTEAELRAESALIGLEMELAEIRRVDRVRKGCPKGWNRVESDNPAHPRKVRLTIRIDKDVAKWFWQKGEGYQSQMNAVLRLYMEAKRSEIV